MTETDPEKAQTFDLLDRLFKNCLKKNNNKTVLQRLKELKEDMVKTGKQYMNKMRISIKYRNYEKETKNYDAV